MVQTSSGTVLSTHNSVPVVVDQYSYPIAINFTNSTQVEITVALICSLSSNSTPR
ncbi:hypothetical protein CPB84DRAFT_1776698 [Gymnopilus junonius]|uniref:Uncharacterized protein n=1 Tax=Gymnopilus junonius TaxID=109634 RepID=A0A9P5TMW0_GYMJU|nr:hypothetical protein CPB84DRAFT_1776698 [Gymnopilus junonius]